MKNKESIIIPVLTVNPKDMMEHDSTSKELSVSCWFIVHFWAYNIVSKADGINLK